MLKVFIMIASAILLLACNQQSKKVGETTPTKSEQTETKTTVIGGNEIIVDSPKEGELNVTLSGQLSGVNDYKVYVFEAKKGQKLTAMLKPETTPANLRFSKIVSPTGISDGPFGIEMTYDLKEDGKWKLTVGESNMNGENYTGKYTLTLSVK